MWLRWLVQWVWMFARNAAYGPALATVLNLNEQNEKIKIVMLIISDPKKKKEKRRVITYHLSVSN